MNVIFLDFDGVLFTVHHNTLEDLEKRVQILAEICREYDCKIVIEASIKESIDEETLEVEGSTLTTVFNMLKKYEIECIGRTPNIGKKINDAVYYPMWKEYEILAYLNNHPEIKHYCVIDDDDLGPNNSDLNKVRDYLVKTEDYSINPEDEGLLERHKMEVGRVLKLEK